MLKIGHLVPVAVIKAMPDKDAYLTMVFGTELLALLPKRFAGRLWRVGDNILATVCDIKGPWITLTQRSSQFFRKLTETLLAELLRQGEVVVKRAAFVQGAKFSKVAVASLKGDDPVGMAIPYLSKVKQYTDDVITLVRYSADLRAYITSALAPGPPEKIKRIIIMETIGEALVVVEPSHAGLFFGRGGLNVATASKLVGMPIKIDSRSEVL